MEKLGNVIISPNVIRDIITETLKDIDEVQGIYGQDDKSTITSFFKSNDGKKKSVEIEIGETECVVDISLVVNYGIKLKDVAIKVQEILKEKIEEMTDIKVQEINITIEKVVIKEVVENV